MNYVPSPIHVQLSTLETFPCICAYSEIIQSGHRPACPHAGQLT